MRILLPCLLSLSLACGASDPAAGVDAGTSIDGGSVARTDGGDAGDETPDAGGETADAGGETPDAGLVTWGQCGADGDCATGNCNERAPGGFCLECGSDDDCARDDGRGYTCTAFGSCGQDCARDGDCPPGLRCNASSGTCVLRDCASCPAPYVCDGTVCVRPGCDASCPAGACRDGFCVTDL